MYLEILLRRKKIDSNFKVELDEKPSLSPIPKLEALFSYNLQHSLEDGACATKDCCLAAAADTHNPDGRWSWGCVFEPLSPPGIGRCSRGCCRGPESPHVAGLPATQSVYSSIITRYTQGIQYFYYPITPVYSISPVSRRIYTVYTQSILHYNTITIQHIYQSHIKNVGIIQH